MQKKGETMFSEAMLAVDMELFSYNQEELEHYIYDRDCSNECEFFQPALVPVRTIGGTKL